MQHTMSDPLGLRAEFPITESWNYLNCAAIAPLSHAARNAGIAFMDERMYEPWPDPAPMGLIRLRQRKDRVRTAFAKLIGAQPGEIGLVESTSAGENIVARALDLKPGDEIVVDALHFESSYLLYRQLEQSHGIVLHVVAHKEGMIDPEDIAAVCGQRTRLVSVGVFDGVSVSVAVGVLVAVGVFDGVAVSGAIGVSVIFAAPLKPPGLRIALVVAFDTSVALLVTLFVLVAVRDFVRVRVTVDVRVIVFVCVTLRTLSVIDGVGVSDTA